jgi:hypothetical protein
MKVITSRRGIHGYNKKRVCSLNMELKSQTKFQTLDMLQHFKFIMTSHHALLHIKLKI